MSYLLNGSYSGNICNVRKNDLIANFTITSHLGFWIAPLSMTSVLPLNLVASSYSHPTRRFLVSFWEPALPLLTRIGLVGWRQGYKSLLLWHHKSNSFILISDNSWPVFLITSCRWGSWTILSSILAIFFRCVYWALVYRCSHLRFVVILIPIISPNWPILIEECGSTTGLFSFQLRFSAVFSHFIFRFFNFFILILDVAPHLVYPNFIGGSVTVVFSFQLCLILRLHVFPFFSVLSHSTLRHYLFIYYSSKCMFVNIIYPLKIVWIGIGFPYWSQKTICFSPQGPISLQRVFPWSIRAQTNELIKLEYHLKVHYRKHDCPVNMHCWKW